MQWIDDIVLGIIDTYNTTNPYELCDSIGIQIVKLNNSSYLLNDNHSLYIRDYNGTETIFIKSGMNPQFERFYLRHELGHAILHPDVMNTGLTNIDKLEKQANYFAFKLSEIKFDKVELKHFTIEQISSYLELPSAVLKQLIYI